MSLIEEELPHEHGRILETHNPTKTVDDINIAKFYEDKGLGKSKYYVYTIGIIIGIVLLYTLGKNIIDALSLGKNHDGLEKSKYVSETFENSLIGAKGGLILSLILISVAYQYKYGGKQNATTFFGSSKYLPCAIWDAAIAAGCGFISTGFILWSRGGWANVEGNIESLFLVAFILSLFNIAMEASGLNRFLAKTETDEGIGPYADIDGRQNIIVHDEKALELMKQIEEGGDPFLLALSWTVMVLGLIIILFLMIKMLIISIYGYRNVPNNDWGTTGRTYFNDWAWLKEHWKVALLLETIIMVVINIIPPIVAPLIRKEGEIASTTSSKLIIAFMTVATIAIQFMFQHVGFFNVNAEYKGKSVKDVWAIKKDKYRAKYGNINKAKRAIIDKINAMKTRSKTFDSAATTATSTDVPITTVPASETTVPAPETTVTAPETPVKPSFKQRFINSIATLKNRTHTKLSEPEPEPEPEPVPVPVPV
jgi:hypothetical protein